MKGNVDVSVTGYMLIGTSDGFMNVIVFLQTNLCGLISTLCTKVGSTFITLFLIFPTPKT